MGKKKLFIKAYIEADSENLTSKERKALLNDKPEWAIGSLRNGELWYKVCKKFAENNCTNSIQFVCKYYEVSGDTPMKCSTGSFLRKMEASVWLHTAKLFSKMLQNSSK